MIQWIWFLSHWSSVGRVARVARVARVIWFRVASVVSWGKEEKSTYLWKKDVKEDPVSSSFVLFLPKSLALRGGYILSPILPLLPKQCKQYQLSFPTFLVQMRLEVDISIYQLHKGYIKLFWLQNEPINLLISHLDVKRCLLLIAIRSGYIMDVYGQAYWLPFGNMVWINNQPTKRDPLILLCYKFEKVLVAQLLSTWTIIDLFGWTRSKCPRIWDGQ